MNRFMSAAGKILNIDPPYGLAGGASGSPGVNRVARRQRAARALRAGQTMPGKFQVDLDQGAVLTVASPGGGGYGRPRRTTTRTPARSRRR